LKLASAAASPDVLDPQELRPKRALYLQRVNAHLAWLAEVLADGGKFILGDDPSAADLSAYHPIWFARQNGGSEVNELIAFAPVIDPWYTRVAGHWARQILRNDTRPSDRRRKGQ
jgi:glutathione S-transferase